MLRFFRRSDEQTRARTEEAVQKSRRTWFGRIMGILRSSDLDQSLWERLEEVLISGDVGVDTSSAIIGGLRKRAQNESLRQPEEVFSALKEELVSVLASNGQSPNGLNGNKSEASPYVILVVGVNGVGKTTSIAKLASHYQQMGNEVIMAAADTFRAAAIDQLQILGQQVDVDVIAHRQGADPGAVAYDAFKAARARGGEVLIIDTAGRLHTKTNLMEEMKKIRSVVNRLDPQAPHEVLLVLDATIGHNGLAQARAFTEAVSCTGVFLTKLDGTAKGGIALAIKKELGLPVQYIGTGEQIKDIAPFNPEEFIEALLAPVN
jgi:fused signal recognition particle receptor